MTGFDFPSAIFSLAIFPAAVLPRATNPHATKSTGQAEFLRTAVVCWFVKIDEIFGNRDACEN